MQGERKILDILKSVFGYEDFLNDAQKSIAAALHTGKHLFICMPPGWGKSLCAQLSAVLNNNKVTIVVSPKFLTMQREVQFLQSKGINACLLTRKTKRGAEKEIINDTFSKEPKIRILYCSPEIAVRYTFQCIVKRLKEKSKLSCIVYDDASFMSHWGYDYMSTYRKLKLYTNLYSYIPTIIITRSLRMEAVKEISQTLCITDPKLFYFPLSNKKVYYDVCFIDTLSDPIEHLKEFIMKSVGVDIAHNAKKLPSGAVVIYCRKQYVALELNKKLNSFGISTIVCPNKVDQYFNDVKAKWLNGKASVFITTCNYKFIHDLIVRCIVYWTIPKSVAKFYNESNEMYRSKQSTYCRLYFSMDEYCDVKRSIMKNNVTVNKDFVEKQFIEFKKLMFYCLTAECRHKMIANYYGRDSTVCGNYCDICRESTTVKKATLEFIRYSELIGQIKYDLCDVKEDAANIDNNEREKDNENEACRTTSVAIVDKKQESNKSKISSESSEFYGWSSVPVNQLIRKIRSCNIAQSPATSIITNLDIGSPSEEKITQSFVNKCSISKTVIAREPARLTKSLAKVDVLKTECTAKPIISGTGSYKKNTNESAKEVKFKPSDKYKPLRLISSEIHNKKSNTKDAEENEIIIEYERKVVNFKSKKRRVSSPENLKMGKRRRMQSEESKPVNVAQRDPNKTITQKVLSGKCTDGAKDPIEPVAQNSIESILKQFNIDTSQISIHARKTSEKK